VWEADGQVVVHRGTVGERGETEHCQLAEGQAPNVAIDAQVASARAQGYETLSPDPERQVVVACDTMGYDPDEITASARVLEVLCNECLAGSGNGYCDGPTYGHNRVSVFCPVVNREMAVAAVIAALRGLGCDNWDEWLLVSVPDGASFRVLYGNPAAQRAGLV
jgi:hypothetical protein